MVAAPAPLIVVLLPVTSRSPIELSPENPSPAPPAILSWYVPVGRLIVVPGLRLAKATAPRRLQSFTTAVHAEAATASSVRSTVTGGGGRNIVDVRTASLGAAAGPRTLMR